MGKQSSRWFTIAESQFPWEREALEFIRDRIPDAEPYRAWANFEFIADDGSINEVDLLILTPKGFYFVEIKSWPGEISGDTGTWTWRKPEGGVRVYDNPLLLANRKAKKLKSLLGRQKALRRAKLPFLKAIVFLSDPQLKIRLADHALTGVCRRDPDPRPGGKQGRVPGVVHELKFGSSEEYHRRGYKVVDGPLAKAITRAMDEAGIRPSTKALRVGDYQLGKLLAEGPGYQDFLGTHVSLKSSVRRIRVFGVGRGVGRESKETLSRAAQREFSLLEGLEHPGILVPLTYTEAELGPALIFQHDPEAVRLDHYLQAEGERLGVDQRLDLLRQLGEAVAYAHQQRLVHRALSPQSVLVRDLNTSQPRLQILNWTSATRAPESNSATRSGFTGTSHPDQLVEERTLVYMAPEAHRGPQCSDQSADVFSLGAIAYRLFSGQPPASSAVELQVKLRGEDGQAACGLQLAETADGVGTELAGLIQWATDPRLTARLDSAKDFLAALDEVEEELTNPHAADEPLDPTEARKDDVLPGGFKVLRRLGTGSTARVFLVQRGDEEERVLKLALTPDQNDRLRDEGEVLQKLRHPRIVACHGVVEIGDRVGLLLESGGEETLRDRLREDGRQTQDLLQRFGDDLLDAVEFLEQEGYPHRDLKPENLGIAQDSTKALRLVLFDFSLSRAPLEQIRAGTPGYLDPFLSLRPNRRWDVHAESFSAAVVLHEMASAALPSWGDGQSDPALIDDEVTVASDRFAASLRAGLTEFFRRALRRDFRERFHNPREMRDAWRTIFEQSESRRGGTQHDPDAAEAALRAALEEATRETPLSALPIAGRVLEAFERINAVTVADALTIRAARLFTMRGVGNATRKSVLDVIHLLGASFPAGPEILPPDPDPGPPLLLEPEVVPLDALLAGLLPKGKRKADERNRQTLRLHLGLDPLSKSSSAGLWPGQAEVAKDVGITRGRVSQLLGNARKRWAKDKALTLLRDTLAELMAGLGGLATVAELEAALLGLRGDELPEQAPQAAIARALVRAALETERHRPEQRWAIRRSGVTVLVALEQPPLEAQTALDFAERLGRAARRLAIADPLPSPARVEAELRAVDTPGELVTLSPERLVRLAAAASREAAASSRLELYPRAMPAARALDLARGAILGAAQLSEEQVRQRVAARYPEAESLPARPRLDTLLANAGLELHWSATQNSYLHRTKLTLGLSSRTASRGRVDTAIGEPLQALSPELADARQLEERLARAAREGGFLILAVEPRLLAAARHELGRFGPSRVSLEAELLSHLRAVADEKKVPWATVLKADAHGPSGKGWKNLLRLVRVALDRLRDQLLATPGVVLLTEPGLAARYDQVEFLAGLRQALDERSGSAGTTLEGLWLLLPQDSQQALPVLEGHAIPVIAASQWTRLPDPWVHNHHRGADAASAKART
jgi:serine/threonine protein kinase